MNNPRIQPDPDCSAVAMAPPYATAIDTDTLLEALLNTAVDAVLAIDVAGSQRVHLC